MPFLLPNQQHQSNEGKTTPQCSNNNPYTLWQQKIKAAGRRVEANWNQSQLKV